MKEIIISTEYREEVINHIKKYGEIIFVSKWLNIIAFKPHTNDLSFLQHRFIDNYYDSEKGELIKC